MKTFLLLNIVFIATFISCGGGSKVDDDIIIGEKPGPFKIDRYLDYSLVTSDELTKGIFISGRDLAKNKGDDKLAQETKLFKIDLGDTAATPSRVTDIDLGSEQQVALSGDGKWVAIIARSKGIKKLYLQSYVLNNKRVELTAHVAENHDVKDVVFSNKSPYILAYRTESKTTDGTKNIFLVKFDATSDEITDTSIQLSYKIPKNSASEIGFSEIPGVSTASTYDLVVQNKIEDLATSSTTYKFEKYSFATLEATTPLPTAIETDTSLLRILPGVRHSSNNKLHMIKSLTPDEYGDSITPIGDSENKIKEFAKEKVLNLELAPGAVPTEITNEVTNPIYMSVVSDDSARLIYGTERIACKDRKEYRGSAILINDTALGTTYKRLYISVLNDAFTLHVADHPCQLLNSDLIINEKYHKVLDLKKDSSGVYHLFIQSQYYTDIEIYRYKFRISAEGVLSEVSFLDISKNSLKKQ